MNTLAVVAEGLARYLGWWLSALVRWRDPRAPMSVRRFVVLTLGMPIFLGVQLVHAICLLLDEILFPGYRRTSLDGTLVITGIPRSGTTFLHRILSAETEHYTTLTTWEALLAPSILQRRLVSGLAWLDGCLGGPLARGLAGLTRRLTSGLDAIHEVGLTAAEEDYLTLLPAAGCFVMLLAFPAAPGLQSLGEFDRAVAPQRRRRLLHFYRACLQRHVYADGARRQLLSKNAALGSWVVGLQQALPEARFIVCLRDPHRALSSQISSVAAARSLFGTATGSAAFQRLFLHIYAVTLEHLTQTIGDWPLDRAAIVDLTDVRAHPAPVIREALHRLGVREHASLSARLNGLGDPGPSAHRHSIADLGIDTTTLDERMTPSYRRLMALPHRIRVTP
ncbi:sulfotransferase [Arhodomonas sp. SL1]|uniref:sulfotransferase n=1 Tax=Arhodomonas sp. SL1 TaxID=3425691 RepID=UPI003F8804A6